MTTTTDAVITVSRNIAAPPDQVFDAWLDPAVAKHFLFATPDGEIIRCEIDARVGGRFFIVDRRKDGDAEHHGEFTEIDRPNRFIDRGHESTVGPSDCSTTSRRDGMATVYRPLPEFMRLGQWRSRPPWPK